MSVCLFGCWRWEKALSPQHIRAIVSAQLSSRKRKRCEIRREKQQANNGILLFLCASINKLQNKKKWNDIIHSHSRLCFVYQIWHVFFGACMCVRTRKETLALTSHSATLAFYTHSSNDSKYISLNEYKYMHTLKIQMVKQTANSIDGEEEYAREEANKKQRLYHIYWWGS